MFPYLFFGDNGGLSLLLIGWAKRLKNAVVPFLFITGEVINLIIKNKRFISIVKEIQIFDVDEISKKLERPLVALQRLKQGKELPKTFRDIALGDLEQAIFLLDGTKELLNDNKKNSKNILL